MDHISDGDLSMETEGEEIFSGQDSPNEYTKDPVDTQAQPTFSTSSPSPTLISTMPSPSKPNMQSRPATEMSPSLVDKYRRVVTYQFDLELLQKWREVRVIEEELERGRQLLGYVEKMLLNDHIYGGGVASGPSGQSSISRTETPPVPSDLWYTSNASSQSQPSHNYSITSSVRKTTPRAAAAAAASAIASSSLTSSRPNTPTENVYNQFNPATQQLYPPNALGDPSAYPLSFSVSSGGPTFQYDVKADGTVVRLSCPKCGADRFRSMLGFLNHCRLNCRLMFASQEDRLNLCGTPVDPDKVPSDYFTKHPTQLKQEIDLAQIRADVQGPQIDVERKPKIRVYNESNEEVNVNADVDVLIDADMNSIPLDYERQDPIAPSPSTDPTINPTHCYSDQAKSVVVHSPIPSRKLIPTSLAPHHTNVDQLESRFYQRKRIVIGNFAARLADSAIDSDSSLSAPRPPSHKWKLYVRLANNQPENRIKRKIDDDNIDPLAIQGSSEIDKTGIGKDDLILWTFVKSVRFILHQSYHPYDHITIDQPPFELVRSGWGEFPVRIELSFWDESKNRPVEFVHQLRLRQVHQTRWTCAGEQTFDVDLDRNTEFKAVDKLLQSIVPQPQLNSTNDGSSGDGRGNDSGAGNDNSDGTITKSTLDDVDLLGIYSRYFSLFGTTDKMTTSDMVGTSHPPKRSLSFIEFSKLTDSEKYELEIDRAQSMRTEITKRYPEFKMTTEQIMQWCRDNHLSWQDPTGKGLNFDVLTSIAMHKDEQDLTTGAKKKDQSNILSDPLVAGIEELVRLKYCRYCGLAHSPQDRFEILQKNCSIKPRKLHLSSRTASSELLKRFKLLEKGAVTVTDKDSALVKLEETNNANGLGTCSNVDTNDDSSILIEDAFNLDQHIMDNQDFEQQQNYRWIVERLDELDLSCGTDNARTLRIIWTALKCFMRDLVTRAVERIPETGERNSGRPAVITPVHIYMAVTTGININGNLGGVSSTWTTGRNDGLVKFDFLTNAHMSGT